MEASPSKTDEVWHDANESSHEYSGVVIKGIKKDSNQEEILKMLHEAGLPETYGIEDCLFIDKFEMMTIYIHDLKSEMCVQMVKNLHRKVFHDMKLAAYSLVEDTPTKTLKDDLELSTKSTNDPLKMSSPEKEEALEGNDPSKNKDSVAISLDTQSSSGGIIQNMVSKFFGSPTENMDDEEGSNTEESNSEVEDISGQFKRKQSSEVELGFEVAKKRRGRKKDRKTK